MNVAPVDSRNPIVDISDGWSLEGDADHVTNTRLLGQPVAWQRFQSVHNVYRMRVRSVRSRDRG